jgi:hypothetical protein
MNREMFEKIPAQWIDGHHVAAEVELMASLDENPDTACLAMHCEGQLVGSVLLTIAQLEQLRSAADAAIGVLRTARG